MPRRLSASPPVPDPEPTLPSLHLAADYPAAVVAAAVASGSWTRVRRGAYVDAHGSGDRYAAELNLALARIAAVARALRAPHVVSHESAALLWALPLLRPPTRVHVVQSSSRSSRSASDVVRHVVDLPAEHVTVRSGLSVTGLERTTADCARTLRVDEGLVVLDAALHRGASREWCEKILHEAEGGRGVRRAWSLLTVADDGAESPGESLARLAILRLGVTPPETQVRVATGLGVFWADLGWPGRRVLIEYDGVAKYSAAGETVDAVLREKRREDALREAGWIVIRITKHDLADLSRLRRRLRQVLPPEDFGRPVDPWLRPARTRS